MDDDAPIGPKAQTRNEKLAPLAFLIGNWRTTGTHPMLPGKSLSGRTSFDWHEGGAFLIMRNEVDEDGFPDGVAIIGSDKSGALTMIYFDERGVSRHFTVEAGSEEVRWRRDDPELAQSVSVRAEGNGLVSEGRMAENGGPWGPDLSQRFERM